LISLSTAAVVIATLTSLVPVEVSCGVDLSWI
jgi:hypothetical protein